MSARVHTLGSSGLAPADLMEGFALQAKFARESLPFSDRARALLRELEDQLATEAALIEADAILADAEALA